MFHRNANSIEEHKDDDEPIKSLRFDRVSDPKPEPLFLAPKFNAATVAHSRSEIRRPREPCKIHRHELRRFVDFILGKKQIIIAL